MISTIRAFRFAATGPRSDDQSRRRPEDRQGCERGEFKEDVASKMYPGTATASSDRPESFPDPEA
jgi:hypothetical protein